MNVRERLYFLLDHIGPQWTCFLYTPKKHTDHIHIIAGCLAWDINFYFIFFGSGREGRELNEQFATIGKSFQFSNAPDEATRCSPKDKICWFSKLQSDERLA